MSGNCANGNGLMVPEALRKTYSNGISKELPAKQFVPRNSLLTDLYKNRNFQIVHQAFMAILVGQFLHSAASDILYKGRLDLGIDLIQRSFSNPHWIAIIWLCMFASTVSVFFGFKLWATVRTGLKPTSASLKSWDRAWIAAVVAYYVGFFYWPAVAMTACDIRPAAKFGFTCEILRMLMKSHAFVRANAPKVLKRAHRADEKQAACPEFGKFMYFLWAPTFLYRDSYPRTASINWRFVLDNLLQLAAVIFFTGFIFEKYIIDVFKDYGRKPFVWQDAVVVVFANTPTGIALMISLFFTIQHAWMNAAAEALTFADRLFYQDWWTATSFKDYFRKWNVLVQDWIYAYVYKDLYEVVMPNNKMAANYVIFFASAIAHEYITSLTFGFFFPVLFVLFFGCGAQFVIFGNGSEKKGTADTFGTVVVFYCNAFGMSLTSTCFAIEYFYRQNCPVENATFTNYLIPRFFTCKL